MARIHEEHESTSGSIDWKLNGVKIIPGDQLDPNTAQTPGMNRAAEGGSHASTPPGQFSLAQRRSE
jgi:hypothetical protein